MNKNLETIKKYWFETLLVTLVALTFLFLTPIANFFGETLAQILPREIEYHTQCGQEPPLLVKIPDLTNGRVFSCEFNVNKDAFYEVSLQYPYANRTERKKKWDMLGGAVYTTKDGIHVIESTGSISYSILGDGKEIVNKTKVAPKITSYGGNNLNTELKTFFSKNNSKYIINISGIPKEHYSQQGLFLFVGKRIF